MAVHASGKITIGRIATAVGYGVEFCTNSIVAR
jgi:hypothetical protein